MKKNNIILIIVLVLVVGLLIWLFSRPSSKYLWFENYKTTNSQPFGLDHTLDFMETIFSDRDFIIPDSAQSWTFQNWKDSIPSNFIHIGGYLPMDSAALSEFYQYVENGNTAMFIVKNIPNDIKDYINDGECLYNWEEFDEIRDTIVRVNFNHPQIQRDSSFEFSAINRKGPVKLDFLHFGDLICTDNYSFTPIGTLNDSLVNFVEVPFGQGYIYIHSNPVLFTNYFIIQESGANYARDVFAHLNEGPIIYEDRRYKGDFFGSSDGSRNYNGRNEGPFRYILSQESFRWALYTLLGLLVIYLVFGTKRKQSPIPVRSLPENSSIEYVETISELYFQSQGKSRIAQYLFDQYYDFIRSNYQLLKGDDQAKFLKKLSLKSEIPMIELKEIEELNDLRPHKMAIEQSDLVNYYKKLEEFYSKCK